jgi:hypothetical protein
MISLNHRQPKLQQTQHPTELRHHLEAITQLDPDEQAAIRTLIEGTLLRHQARKLAAS